MTSTHSVSGRKIAALLHPRPAVLVTTCGEGGHPNASAVAWVMPLSHAAPLVGISLRSGSRTQSLVARTEQVVVDIIGTSMRREVEVGSRLSGWHEDKIGSCGLGTEPVCHVAPSRLVRALPCLECAVVKRALAGDHVFFNARVLEVGVSGADLPADKEGGGAAVLLCETRDRSGHFTHEEVL